jgi:hypothetical protein
MIKKILLFLLLVKTVEAQSLSSILTQRGGTHNALFLNPAQLSSQHDHSELKVDIINTSLSLSHESYTFLKELESASSSSNQNSEISELLKKNIGKKLSFSSYNFSSISQKQENLSWSLGIVNTLGGYFITHSGFGSKGAMESFLESYTSLIATVSLEQENLAYGINIKGIEKTQSIHNYSINEMITNNSFSDYFDTENKKRASTIGVDVGLVYTVPQNVFNPKLSFSILNIGNSSFQEIGTLVSTTNLGFTLNPCPNTFVQFDYVDLFKHQAKQDFENSFKAYLSQDFLDKKLKVHSGILYNALSLGVEYHYSLITLALDSYKNDDYNQGAERKYNLSIALSW